MARMTLRVLTPPAQEPISLDLLSRHLRLDQDFDDPLLSIYLTSARAMAELYTGRALITQTLQWTVADQQHQDHELDTWWGSPVRPYPRGRRPIELPLAPVQSIAAFAILDRQGNVTATQQTSAATPSGSVLTFPAAGCPAAVGQYVQDLTAGAAIMNGTQLIALGTQPIAYGTTVRGVSIAGGIASVTLSAPVGASIGQGDNILFSSLIGQPAASSAVSLALGAAGGGSIFLADLSLSPAKFRPDWIGAIAQLQTVTPPVQHQQIAFVAGYGADGTFSTGQPIPLPIINAILLTAAALYERRGDEADAEMPKLAQWLLDRYRIQFFE
jgi:uncharacterized phiE125 gp8 family phage protein